MHANAPLSVEGRRRLVQRCQDRPIAHVAAEMGISRQCASKWVNRFHRFGELGLLDRSSAPGRQPTATPVEVLVRIEQLRRDRKWPARRIASELAVEGQLVSVRTVSRHLARLGLNRRRFLDPGGETNRAPRRIIARRPGHMVHVDIKKVGRIPDGGGWLERRECSVGNDDPVTNLEFDHVSDIATLPGALSADCFLCRGSGGSSGRGSDGGDVDRGLVVVVAGLVIPRRVRGAALRLRRVHRSEWLRRPNRT
ncbi:transposase [Nocardia sp. GAS34]